jgi:hypothetical protein
VDYYCAGERLKLGVNQIETRGVYRVQCPDTPTVRSSPVEPEASYPIVPDAVAVTITTKSSRSAIFRPIRGALWVRYLKFPFILHIHPLGEWSGYMHTYASETRPDC